MSGGGGGGGSGTRVPRIVWSPHRDDQQFLVGSNDLRLYEWIPEKKNMHSSIAMVAVNSDVQLMKCFAWSPDSTCRDLVAVGLTNGRTLLVRLHPIAGNLHPGGMGGGNSGSGGYSVRSSYISGQQGHLLSAAPSSLQTSAYPTFDVRYSRPCNVVAFSDAEPRLLATGLDKVRNDHCLAIWDVEQARDMAEVNVPSTSSGAPPSTGSNKLDVVAEASHLLRTGSTGSVIPDASSIFRYATTSYSIIIAPKPIQQYGMSEAVLSCSWFPKVPTQLVAGMAHKWLRVYDTRTSSNEPASIAISTKAVYGVQVDPFHNQRMASFTEDGVVRIWDVRKPNDAVLSIQAATRSASLETIIYSPRRSGLLATHGKDSPYIRLWDLQEGTTRNYTSTTILPQSESTNQHGGSTIGNNTNSTGTAVQNGPQRVFGFGPTTQTTSHDTRTGGVNVTGATSSLAGFFGVTSGSSERVSSPSLPSSDPIDVPVLWRSRQTKPALRPLASFAWIPTTPGRATSSLMSVNRDGVIECVELQEARRIAWDPCGGLLVAGDQDIFVFPTSSLPAPPHQIHLRSTQTTAVSAVPNAPHIDEPRRITPLPAQISSGLGILSAQQSVQSSRRNSRDAELMRIHMSTDTMGAAPQKPASAEVRANRQTIKAKAIEELRTDISVVMRERAIHGYSMNPEKNRTFIRDDRKLHKYGPGLLYIAEEQLSTMGRLVSQGVDFSYQGVMHIVQGVRAPKRATSTPQASSPMLITREETPMAPTLKPELRTIALLALGFSGRIEATMETLQASGDYERAAAWALFHGKVARAVAALSSSKDEKHRLISTVLAGYHRDTTATIHGGPYLRAIFAYIASGEWSSVLAITDLPFRDRLGVALRFLSDDELLVYIEEYATRATARGDIDGLILTGLTSVGVGLLSRFVDRTGDVQTASLIVSQVPLRKFKDARVEDWVSSYRFLLDRWQCYHVRARFDIDRGRRQRIQGDTSGIPAPQVYLLMPDKDGRRVAAAPGMVGQESHTSRLRTYCCPNCRNMLPRCSLCLMRLGTPVDEIRQATALHRSAGQGRPAGFDLWFTWCQSCRHGGHAAHLLEWFEDHERCPVSDCHCRCLSA
ncbi:hypothetical protein BDF19DRAFT_433141 [Syncephalis fuscata]|nr:hypothetical protein BDF19DRAFT_433141 [Syncephalis fuscata]